ncbi:CcmD family protein [Pontibacter sp. 13R65]|uniref:CcmD family protein n=1 Tax=Pontibacter sp. 13R65 TaxID=3127458 RepID=UPI00301CC4F1
MKLLRILSLWFLLLGTWLGAGATVQAQPAQSEGTTIIAEPEVEMADVLRRDGKIYVVVVVILTLLGGVLIYLISLDRKVSKLERQVKDEVVNR